MVSVGFFGIYLGKERMGVRALKTDGNDLEASWSAALLEIFEGNL